jgi:hypothetical protein
MRQLFLRSHSVSDEESWGREKHRAGEKEIEIKGLIYLLSDKKLALRRVGVGVEGEDVDDEEKVMARKILDYVIWNVESGELLALADIVSTRYSFEGSKFFPVALWKKEVMNANAIPTALIYELEKEPAELKDRIWWYLGCDIGGEIIKSMPTRHRGQIIHQDVVASRIDLWKRGVNQLIERLTTVIMSS